MPAYKKQALRFRVYPTKEADTRKSAGVCFLFGKYKTEGGLTVASDLTVFLPEQPGCRKRREPVRLPVPEPTVPQAFADRFRTSGGILCRPTPVFSCCCKI